MTQETFVALTTTIESQEWVMRQNQSMNKPPEHPQASTMDDVECFFSLLRNMIGKYFTVKDVRFTWRKICKEFAKRFDNNSPYYYYVSKHEGFLEGDNQHLTYSGSQNRTQGISESIDGNNLGT